MIGGNAHFRHDFEQALIDSFDVAFDGVLGADFFVEFLLEIFDHFKSEPRIDGLGAISGEAGEVVGFARLAGFDDEADRSAQAFLDQEVMDGGGREQRRDSDALMVHQPVGEDDDGVAISDSLERARAQTLDHALYGEGAAAGGVGGVERFGAEMIIGDIADHADFFQILIAQDGLADFEPLAPCRAAVEKIGARPMMNDTSDITSSSRIGSIGGLVTWAKFCLK